MATIVHVDDDPIMQQLVSRQLTAAGHDVTGAEDGLQGAEIAIRINPDLVLMDIEMPVMDGFTATTKLRAEGYAGVVVAVTGSERMRDLANAVLAGCDDYIPKPIGPDFQIRVEDALARGRPSLEEDLESELLGPAEDSETDSGGTVE